jgi:glycogen synthase
MKFEKIMVSGERQFVNRHQALFDVISSQSNQLDYVYDEEFSKIIFVENLAKVFRKSIRTFFPAKFSEWQNSDRGFIARSKRTESKIRKLDCKPDLVLHIFGMYSPFWDNSDIPYAMYLDYTAALAHRKSPLTEKFFSWKDCEKTSYDRAYHLFVMSHLVKYSLIDDYGILPEKITVVGSFASGHKVYEGEKKFGTQQILFNGADFERKGGDLVIAAFKHIKKALPAAKLVIIGKKITAIEEGVDNPGKIKSLSEMRKLFLDTDLVIAPGRCDPFPTFAIEAMNYGVPCLVSNNDGMPEIVDRDINGAVVDDLTPEAIAEKAIDLLNNIPVLTSMSHQARHKVKHHFNCDIIARKIIQTLS